MKNLLIYTGPQKKFGDEDRILAKIQIDNSFDLGWKKEDILLVTNFDYEYNGVKSFVIEKDVYYPFDIAASKLPVLIYLIRKQILATKELYWCHDFDAYENYPINESELELENFDVGLTHYFYKPQWQFSSVFFKTAALDIFELIDKTTREKPHLSRNNEKTLTKLMQKNAIANKRYKKLNVTYNFTKRYIPIVYQEASKPLKVLHFRPSDTREKDPLLQATSTIAMFMHKENRLKIPLMSDRLIKIFNYHGIK